MDEHDDFLDDILGDSEESVGQMLDAVNSKDDDDDDDSLDNLLASPPASPTKESKGKVDPNAMSLAEASAIAKGYAEDDDMLDDLLASPSASKDADESAADENEKSNLRGSFLSKEISDMEDALDDALEPSENQEDESGDDLSDALHGNLDDLDLGDFEAQPEEKAQEPVKVEATKEKESSPPTPTSETPTADVVEKHQPPMSPLTHGDDSEFDDFDAFLDDALDETAATPKPAPAPAPSKPKSKPKPAPAPAAAKPKPAAKKPTVPRVARKPAAPKIKPTTTYDDQPVGDIKKPKKKPLSFLKKKTTPAPAPAPATNGEKKKPAAKKGFMSTISRWSNRSKDKKSTPSVARSVATSVATTRSAATHRSTASGKNAMTSGGAVCSIVAASEKSRGSDIIQCGVQFNPMVHGFRAPCDLCLHFLSDKETFKFLETGRSPRVMYTRGGCCTDCLVFPRAATGPSIRLCRQCYYNSHRDVFQKYVQEHNVLQTISA